MQKLLPGTGICQMDNFVYQEVGEWGWGSMGYEFIKYTLVRVQPPPPKPSTFPRPSRSNLYWILSVKKLIVQV